ncbi:2,3-dihydro-2,3-dihydroxybenzoate dehydrogenase [Chitiniphilus shinanonensis]|uniref:2,3-dihydro-2,3-dihydroxybenzoate dehydrogenase n=1 Tax=Chitiniphilus shinanonensis TaxID=553088 RepID=A0ABQ6BXY8_9NEIS|nr:2,3-dihydro-2,3-dihydroxybenzoate dehydrogenase [Chitiniphilus shinanonensis]GLS06242.1 2,3-dihydro-2,3-dihydroxybenzoate dehydrogenase [Chitiniphilus shinanonensis]
MDPQRFAGRAVLVTGAAQGIGAAIVRRLLADGATVHAADRNAGELAHLAEGLAPAGRLYTHVLDIARPDAVRATVAAITDAAPLHGLVNCAGVLTPGSLLDTDADTWRQTFEVNVHGTFHVSQAVARHMAGHGDGAIVTVASNAGLTPRVEMGAYCASKAAAAMLTRCLGLELGRHGIRCNVVSPGSTRTPMLTTLLGEWSADADRRLVDGDPQRYRTGIPLRKVAEPDDIARAVAFLLSPDAGHITMQNLVIDGGATF